MLNVKCKCELNCSAAHSNGCDTTWQRAPHFHVDFQRRRDSVIQNVKGSDAKLWMLRPPAPRTLRGLPKPLSDGHTSKECIYSSLRCCFGIKRKVEPRLQDAGKWRASSKMDDFNQVFEVGVVRDQSIKHKFKTKKSDSILCPLFGFPESIHHLKSPFKATVSVDDKIQSRLISLTYCQDFCCRC